MLTNIALQLMGKVPVNLNYTSSPDTLANCAKRCGITQVLTSKKFLERLPIDVPGETILLEDIRESVTAKDRILGMLTALFVPVRLIEWSLGAPRRGEDDLATIIFSSGSEGEPKGAMLTYRNIVSQVLTVGEVFPHDKRSCLVGLLPFFHSFGFTATIWVTLLNGVRTLYHPNPLEPRVIGGLTKDHGGTILMATTTFLRGFIRRCSPEQLASLEFVVTGAEKLPDSVHNAFQEKFGIEPMEGFGATECAPVVAVNVPNYVSPGFHVCCTKPGTIGRPLPGQMVRIVSPETGEAMPNGEAGLMLTQGPNLMRGYLDDPERTKAAFRDGWYVTGDIASLDEDDFITITDRLARFSKIAGEMIPHTKVEEILHDLLEVSEQRLTVTSVPDPAKGERLVVLHTLSDAERDSLIRKMQDEKVHTLWRPRANAFHRIEEIPLLGTGKLDLTAIKKLAREFEGMD